MRLLPATAQSYMAVLPLSIINYPTKESLKRPHHPLVVQKKYKYVVFDYQCACGICIHSAAFRSVTSFISKYSFTSYHYTTFRFHFMHNPQHRTA